MKIALVYNEDVEYTTGTYIKKVIDNAGINYEHFWTENAHNIPDDFDLYFRIDHGDYKYDLPADLHPAVFYAIDTHLKKPFKKMCRQVPHYDIVFCGDKRGTIRLHKKTKVDTHWVPLGCDPEIHKKLDIPKKYDIGFVGRNAEKFDRGRHLKILREKYPNSYIGEANFRDMSKIYSASKIGFNSSINNYIAMRIFEVLSCGCFLLTNRIKNNGLEDLYEEGKHLVTYKSDKEMLKLINYYLKHPEERERIAKAGYEATINNHTYYHRVQTMFNYIAFKYGGDYNKLRI